MTRDKALQMLKDLANKSAVFYARSEVFDFANGFVFSGHTLHSFLSFHKNMF